MDLFVNAIVTLLLAAPLWAQRVTVPLDGTWEIADSAEPGPPPVTYGRWVPVPGLANLAMPAFEGVDNFDSAELIDKKIRLKLLPAGTPIPAVGTPRQNRNWFWYRTTFRGPARKAVARLKVNKAQFGTAVWLNGKLVGEHLGCFTAGYFDLTAGIRWQAENEVVVRIGAHPAALPESAPAGTDNEKNVWTPGIYDSVAVLASDNPVIESVQVAPRIAGPEILVETRLRNYGAAGTFHLAQTVDGQTAEQRIALGAGEEKMVRQTLRMPGSKLWTPEQPNLYKLATGTGGDTVETRFGIREFRFDTATRRAYLNGKPYFLRGSNITLHRFFEDPECKRLPWDEAWTRKLLVEIPKRFHWNSFRFCIGPVPDKWLDLADEAGLLIQNEFFVWGYRKQWDTAEMKRQYTEWMRDNWNHPSVAIWDADNETRADVLGEIIRAVRPLDLSNRPWDNGYNLPVGADDPLEDHPYLFSRLGKGFEPVDLEKMTGGKSTNSPHPSSHAVILNEYGWLWMTRDGQPTDLTRDVYARLAGAAATPGRRRELYAYYLGGLTEFWRAHRNFAGVLHFVYLTSSFPGAFTADHFSDVAKLELEPRFTDYVAQAFHQHGVYLNFWRPKVAAHSEQRVAVMLVNDDAAAVKGTLTLTLTGGGKELAKVETLFEVAGLGQQSYALDIRVPGYRGEAWLTASNGEAVSRRVVQVE